MGTKLTKLSKSMNNGYLLALISFVIGLIVFVVAYLSMQQNIFIADINQPVLDWMISSRNPVATNIFQFITAISDPQVFAIIMMSATIIWMMKSREKIRPLLFAIAIGLSATISTVIKLITANSRPPIETMIQPYELDFSFPSGHTLIIVVVALTLGYLVYSRRQNKKQIELWDAISLIAISLVASSRLYLGYHWATDILASIGIGFMILAVVIITDKICLKYLKNLK